jgi:hypothetical protein
MVSELERLLARPGRRVKPRLSKLLTWLHRQELTAGRGIRLVRSENGTIIRAAIPNKAFVGAFYVTPVNEKELIVAAGYVNGIEPTIDEVKISGSKSGPPTLAMPSEFEDNRAWVYVEVKINQESERIDPEDPESVIVTTGTSAATNDRFKGRHPVAMILKLEDGSYGARQISYFSLRHAFRDGRHFFVPA